MRIVKSFVAIFLCLCLLVSLGMPAFAANTLGITYYATLDNDNLTANNINQNVTMTISTSSPVTLEAMQATITADAPLTISTIESGDSQYSLSGSYNKTTGKIAWTGVETEDGDITQFNNVTNLIKVTFTIPAGTAAGTYNVGITDLIMSKEYGTKWETGASASTTLTIKEASSGEDTGTTTDSGYEIWYELDSTAGDTENDGAGDGYKEYDISEDAGKKVTATLYIRNTGDKAVSLQAYDIYLTHDSKLTAGDTFTLANSKDYPVAVKKTDGGLHIQAIGQNTTANQADININLPVYSESDAATKIQLGTITFEIDGTSAAYDEELAITLTPGSAEQGETSTNIGIADYKEDGNTTGNKESKYPSVGGTTKGAEVMTTYDVTYDANEGTGAPATQKKQHNNSLTLSTTVPTRDNYSFTGWNTEKDGSGTVYAAGATYSENEAVTLYAVWQQETVTVTWMNGTEEYHKDILNSGTAATAPATNPTKAADAQYTYTFSYWADKDGVKIDTFPALTTDTTYYAVYTETVNQYTVTWYDDSGNQLRQDKVDYGATPSYGTDPTKADSTDGQFSYTFAGWAATQGGDVIQTLPTVDGNEQYYAVFTPVTKEYKVTYNAGAGSFQTGETTEVPVKYGEKPGNIPTPTAPTGYIFSGWSDGTNTYATDLSDFTVSGEVTLTAQYTAEKYTIIFDLNGGTGTKPENIEAEYDKDVTMPTAENFSYTGYAFGGWSVNKTVTAGETIYGGGNTCKNLPYDANKQITLYARWTEDPHTITVISPETGKVEANEQTAKEGDKITLTATPNAGYEFSSWQVKDADGNDVTVGDDNTFTMPDSDVTVTASFVKIDLDVTVTNPAHGKVTAQKNGTETATAQIGDDITLTSSFDEGYELDKYTVTYKVTNTDGVEETKSVELNADGTSFTMPGYSVTVTASYKTTDYTIALDPNGGTISGDDWKLVDGKYTKTYHIESEAITLPTGEDMTKTGYTFAGWYESAAPAEDAQSVSQIGKGSTGDKTYYAKWTPKTDTKYTVNHWQMNLGVEESAEKNDTNYTLKDTDNLTGTTDASVTPAVKSYEGFTAPQTQTVTIKPDGSLVVNYYYTRNSYTITFKDGETPLSDLTITKQYGDSVEAPAGPSKDGYTFKAWDPAVPTTMPAANTTISATWDLVTYNITYKDGDTVLTGLTPATYTIESKDTLPSYSKTNYIFNGWKVTSGANEKWAENAVINAGSSVKGRYGDVTLTADWTEAITYVVEDYKYAADGYKMLRIPYIQTADNGGLEYKFGTASMYYLDSTAGEKYLLNTTDTGVFYYLIESKYVGTDNKLTEDGMQLISTGNVTDRATITYDGKINDDTIVNIADANIVYQMIVNGGGYYTGNNNLSIEQRLGADMHKEAADASVKRATIDDVHKIMAIINGTTTTNP